MGQNSVPYLSIIYEPLAQSLIKAYSGSQMCRLMLNSKELEHQGTDKYQTVAQK